MRIRIYFILRFEMIKLLYSPHLQVMILEITNEQQIKKKKGQQPHHT